ncbi:MAG: hypothetical protein E7320_06630 [Clostridiales bacterium]|nr:hypothetical protein [Clostridiales bacterium]
MKYAVISDIHLYRKTGRFCCALEAMEDADALLIAGDLADRAQPEQYALLRECLHRMAPGLPVYCVCGNHDIPARDDTAYRAFAESIAPGGIIRDESGAFYAIPDSRTDLIGLEPCYHQKQFFFPQQGRQLAFAEQRLALSEAGIHLLLCHPPLIAHNPQRAAGMPPYLCREQDDRLQRLMDAHRNMILLSGHTHYAPTVEWDALRCNLYINNGSICPTTVGGDPAQPRQGNITFLTLESSRVEVRIKGIHTGKEFFRETFRFAE